MKYDVLFSAARNVIAPNYYDTDRFHETITIDAENDQDARGVAMKAIYDKHDAISVGHVILKRVERI